MKNIELIMHLKPSEIAAGEKSNEVKEIFNGTRRRLVEVISEVAGVGRERRQKLLEV